LKQAGINPGPIFSGESLWPWLDDLDVRQNLRALAAIRLGGGSQPHDEERYNSALASKYAERIGDAGAFSRGIVDEVLSVLVAGIEADLAGDQGAQAISLQLQASTEVILSNVDSLTEKVATRATHSDGILPAGAQVTSELVIRASGAECMRILGRIRRRRSLPNVNARAEICGLLARVSDGGDLRLCPPGSRSEVYYWAARLHASDPTTIDKARQFREALIRLDPLADTAVIDAWLDGGSGNWDAALRRFKGVNTPDARTNVMALLRASAGPDAALAWLDDRRDTGPELLTGVGWLNAATLLAQAGRWNEAADVLSKLEDRQVDECPDLLFVDGVLNAAHLYPSDLRRHALAGSVEITPILQEGAEADTRRRHALASFDRAARAMRELDEPERAKAAERLRTWLLLTDKATRAAAEAEVIAAMTLGETAVDAVELACVCNIDFDPLPLERYLRTQELSGGLTHAELLAKMALYRHRKPRSEFIRFLDDNQAALENVLIPGAGIAILITALVEDGRIDRAETVLAANRIALGNDFERLSDFVRTKRGEDILPSLEIRFERTEDLVDLLAVWDQVIRRQDPEKILRYSVQLFQRQRAARNALAVTTALAQLERFDEIVSFLDGCEDLVSTSSELAASKAWALFYRGQFEEARQLVDRLLKVRSDPDDVALDVNLSIATANWEHFSAILDREWPRRDQWPPKRLLQIAFVCAEADRDRAVELARLAAFKGSDDPYILANAYLLVTTLGREDVGLRWMQEAAQLSKEDGPVWIGGLPDAVAMASERFERSREVSRALSEARMPLPVACTLLHTSISKFLISEAHHNARQADWRKRLIIPLRHGGRLDHDTNAIRSITADLTSLILLADLDLLPALIARFDRVRLPWSATYMLMSEVRECRFHQPSQIVSAQRLCNFRATYPQSVSVLTISPQPPEWLVQEVGQDLADLLEAARRSGGRVVRPLPIFQNGSFMERHAELREYRELILTVRQLAHVMRSEAILIQMLFETAMTFLSAVDLGESTESGSLGAGPLYIDDLAITYLITTDLLELVPRLARPVTLHGNTLRYAERLLATESDAAIPLTALSRLRAWIRDGIASGKVSTLPSEPSVDRSDSPIITIKQIVANCGDSDAILIDDRVLGQGGWLIDKSKRTLPVLGIIDLLRDLAGRKLIEQTQRWATHHELRERGFSGIPIEREELEYWLDGTGPNDQDGFLRETAELRVIREYMLRLRSTTFIRQPDETMYLDRVRIAGTEAIRRVWADETVPTPTAAARATWVYEHVMPSPVDWRHTIVNMAAVRPPVEGLANQIATLLPPASADFDRTTAFADWIERAILQPLAIASDTVLDRVADSAKTFVDAWTSNLPQARKQPIAEHLVRIQPVSIRQRLIADEDFLRQRGILVESWVSMAGSPSVRRDDLWDAVRKSFTDQAAHKITSRSGDEVGVAVSEGIVHLTFHRPPRGPQSVAPAQLQLLSPNVKVRRDGITHIIEAFGPTGPDLAVWEPQIALGPLDDDGMERLSSQMQKSVPSYLGRIASSLAGGTITFDSLVPNDMQYYEALCGPKPETAAADQYLGSTLARHRQALVDRDSIAGLQMCLAMTLRDDLTCVPFWTDTPDALWSTLEKIDYRSDPFSILGTLDLALHNASDPRFADLANCLVNDLCQPSLKRDDGVDIYDLISALFSVVDDQIRMVPGMKRQPVLWRRLCSWTHVAMICRILRPIQVSNEFLAWCSDHTDATQTISRLLELRQIPASLPSDTTSYQIRSEVLGRLVHLRQRYTAGGQPFPASDVLDQALQSLSGAGVPYSYCLPGPLEGGRVPQISSADLADEAREVFSRMIDDLTPDLSNKAWISLAYLSRLWVFAEPARAKFIKELGQIRLGESIDSRRRTINVLARLGYVALTQVWPELAETILSVSLKECDATLSPSEVGPVVRMAMIATAALTSENAKLKLNEFLLELGTRLQEAARAALRSEILALWHVTASEEWYLSQSEALSAP
jgi:tetratricopeptide (TPR) repeat protein